MLIGRRPKIDSGELLDALAAGKKPRAIAAAAGCSYSTLRRRLSRHVRFCGFQSVEQAVAQHVATKIRSVLPLAFHGHVDIAMRGRDSCQRLSMDWRQSP